MINVLQYEYFANAILSGLIQKGKVYYFHSLDVLDDGTQTFSYYNIDYVPSIKRYEELEKFEKLGEFTEKEMNFDTVRQA